MNLYKIIFSHSAPKDTKIGTQVYLLANNEDEIYDYIDKNFNYYCWKDKEEENEEYYIYDKNYNLIGTETFHEKIIRLKGEINDEDYDFSDAYYGITLYGWELIKENIKENMTDFINLGIVVIIK